MNSFFEFLSLYIFMNSGQAKQSKDYGLRLPVMVDGPHPGVLIRRQPPQRYKTPVPLVDGRGLDGDGQ